MEYGTIQTKLSKLEIIFVITCCLIVSLCVGSNCEKSLNTEPTNLLLQDIQTWWMTKGIQKGIQQIGSIKTGWEITRPRQISSNWSTKSRDRIIQRVDSKYKESISTITWVNECMQKPLDIVSKEFWLDKRYYAVIGFAENIRNPWAVWDHWCSNWAYQFNSCPGKRKSTRWYGMYFVPCSKDPLCSTRMLAEKIRDVYGCKIVDGKLEDYRCLYKHNGVNPPQWYRNKIDKYYNLLF